MRKIKREFIRYIPVKIEWKRRGYVSKTGVTVSVTEINSHFSKVFQVVEKKTSQIVSVRNKQYRKVRNEVQVLTSQTFVEQKKMHSNIKKYIYIHCRHTWKERKSTVTLLPQSLTSGNRHLFLKCLL